MKSNTTTHPIPEAAELSSEVAMRLTVYLAPLLKLLDQKLDVRLVRSFAATVVNIIRRRDRALSLLLTELGELLTDGAHAPAGVKRLWRLLHSVKWIASMVDDWLLSQADQAVETAIAKDGVAFLPLDGSIIEKPTAHELEGLTKVRSAVAILLRRISGGPPPKIPVLVPGFNWVAAVVTGLTGGFTLARLNWYSPTAPGDEAQQQREAEWSVLDPLLQRWGRKVICLLDRGFAGKPFAGELLNRSARFIIRWKKSYYLVDENGEEKEASQISRRVRSQGKVWVRDTRHSRWEYAGLASIPVWLPGNQTPLWLVVVRRKGKETWYFLTTEKADTMTRARWVVYGYSRRWQVEWAFRYEKSELGIASIRVRLWEYRAKLWAMAELVHAFLLMLVLDSELVKDVLRWCHRTGHRWQKVIAPLYRLRHALANLWQSHGPTLAWSP